MLSLILATLLAPLSYAQDQITEVRTPSGRQLEVIVSMPATPPSGNGKYAAVVAAPGKGYHMGLPLYQELRAQGPAAGYVVYTFNWYYFTQKKAPSKDYAEELEDLETVIALAKKNALVDPERIIISGKSLGSMIAYKAFRRDPSAFGLHLLTPICDTKESLDEFYPNLATVTKPVLFAFGTSDEGCSPQVVKTELANMPASFAILMVPGAHSFELGAFDDPAFTAKNEANIKAVVGMIAQWAKAQFGI